MEKSRNRHIIIVGILSAVAGLLIAYFGNMFLAGRPEISRVKELLRDTTAVIEAFGPPVTIEYIQEGTSVQFHSGIRKGTFRYVISGTATTGSIRVAWESVDEMPVIQSIELIDASHKPIMIFEQRQTR